MSIQASAFVAIIIGCSRKFDGHSGEQHEEGRVAEQLKAVQGDRPEAAPVPAAGARMLLAVDSARALRGFASAALEAPDAQC